MRYASAVWASLCEGNMEKFTWYKRRIAVDSAGSVVDQVESAQEIRGGRIYGTRAVFSRFGVGRIEIADLSVAVPGTWVNGSVAFPDIQVGDRLKDEAGRVYEVLGREEYAPAGMLILAVREVRR